MFDIAYQHLLSHLITELLTLILFRIIEGLREKPNIFLFFPPITQSCSVSDVLFTGGREVSYFSVYKILLVKFS